MHSPADAAPAVPQPGPAAADQPPTGAAAAAHEASPRPHAVTLTFPVAIPGTDTEAATARQAGTASARPTETRTPAARTAQTRAGTEA